MEQSNQLVRNEFYQIIIIINLSMKTTENRTTLDPNHNIHCVWHCRYQYINYSNMKMMHIWWNFPETQEWTSDAKVFSRCPNDIIITRAHRRSNILHLPNWVKVEGVCAYVNSHEIRYCMRKRHHFINDWSIKMFTRTFWWVQVQVLWYEPFSVAL